MQPIIMYGSYVAKRVYQYIEKFTYIEEIKPKLTIISAGDDPASEVYMKNKLKAAEKCGIEATKVYVPYEEGEEGLIETIKKYASKTDGLIVQLPLYKGWNVANVMEAIPADVDVDGLTPYNVGRLHSQLDCFEPCTAAGVRDMLDYYDIPIRGRNVVVIGRSDIVGRPVAELMLEEDATVTICHSKTFNLKEHTLNADIIISAAGVSNLITADMVKDGVVIVDVSINKVDGKLCGDVDFENVSPKCYAISPVPKGVGPVTVAMLMYNTTIAAIKHKSYENTETETKSESFPNDENEILSAKETVELDSTYATITPYTSVHDACFTIPCALCKEPINVFSIYANNNNNVICNNCKEIFKRLKEDYANRHNQREENSSNKE